MLLPGTLVTRGLCSKLSPDLHNYLLPCHQSLAFLPLPLTLSNLGMGILSLTLPGIQYVLSKYRRQERTNECPGEERETRQRGEG